MNNVSKFCKNHRIFESIHCEDANDDVDFEKLLDAYAKLMAIKCEAAEDFTKKQEVISALLHSIYFIKITPTQQLALIKVLLNEEALFKNIMQGIINRINFPSIELQTSEPITQQSLSKLIKLLYYIASGKVIDIKNALKAKSFANLIEKDRTYLSNLLIECGNKDIVLFISNNQNQLGLSGDLQNKALKKLHAIVSADIADKLASSRFEDIALILRSNEFRLLFAKDKEAVLKQILASNNPDLVYWLASQADVFSMMQEDLDVLINQALESCNEESLFESFLEARNYKCILEILKSKSFKNLSDDLKSVNLEKIVSKAYLEELFIIDVIRTQDRLSPNNLKTILLNAYLNNHVNILNEIFDSQDFVNMDELQKEELMYDVFAEYTSEIDLNNDLAIESAKNIIMRSEPVSLKIMAKVLALKNQKFIDCCADECTLTLEAYGLLTQKYLSDNNISALIKIIQKMKLNKPALLTGLSESPILDELRKLKDLTEDEKVVIYAKISALVLLGCETASSLDMIVEALDVDLLKFVLSIPGVVPDENLTSKALQAAFEKKKAENANWGNEIEDQQKLDVLEKAREILLLLQGSNASFASLNLEKIIVPYSIIDSLINYKFDDKILAVVSIGYWLLNSQKYIAIILNADTAISLMSFASCLVATSLSVLSIAKILMATCVHIKIFCRFKGLIWDSYLIDLSCKFTFADFILEGDALDFVQNKPKVLSENFAYQNFDKSFFNADKILAQLNNKEAPFNSPEQQKKLLEYLLYTMQRLDKLSPTIQNTNAEKIDNLKNKLAQIYSALKIDKALTPSGDFAILIGKLTELPCGKIVNNLLRNKVYLSNFLKIHDYILSGSINVDFNAAQKIQKIGQLLLEHEVIDEEIENDNLVELGGDFQAIYNQAEQAGKYLFTNISLLDVMCSVRNFKNYMIREGVDKLAATTHLSRGDVINGASGLAATTVVYAGYIASTLFDKVIALFGIRSAVSNP